MDKDGRIYIAGHRGLAGSALLRCLQGKGYDNIITRTHAELDLTDQRSVTEFFRAARPEYVFLAAAKVGGIHANNTYPAEFIHQNLLIQDNVLHNCWVSGVKRVLFLGSSCIYPRECPQPIREEYLLTGPLEPTNRPYAVAKIAGIETCWAYNRQYGTGCLAAMPTNLYGPGDNYDLQNSHVLPALIRRMHEAKTGGGGRVVLWGSGSPRREFLHSDDMAEACVFLLSLPDSDYARLVDASAPPLINVGCGRDQTIRELAETVRTVVGYEGAIEWDTAMPDGTMRKVLDVSRLEHMGWSSRIGLVEGIRSAYADFLRMQGENPAHSPA